MRNECLDAVREELAVAGIRNYRKEEEGKHIKVRWSQGGQERMVVIPKTPSDWRSALNSRQDVRRLIRKDQPEPVEQTLPPHKRERDKATSQRLGRVEHEVDALADLLAETSNKLDHFFAFMRAAETAQANKPNSFVLRAELASEALGPALIALHTLGIKPRVSPVVRGTEPTEPAEPPTPAPKAVLPANAPQRLSPEAALNKAVAEMRARAEAGEPLILGSPAVHALPDVLPKRKHNVRGRVLALLQEQGPQTVAEIESGVPEVTSMAKGAKHLLSVMKSQGEVVRDEDFRWRIRKPGEAVRDLRSGATLRKGTGTPYGNQVRALLMERGSLTLKEIEAAIPERQGRKAYQSLYDMHDATLKDGRWSLVKEETDAPSQ